jgi:hypothetical protein
VKTTKTIEGYKLKLEAGQRYIATRPFASRRGQSKFPVTISTAGLVNNMVAEYVDDMSYDRANEFLAAFNNGKTTFDGRVW